ncbi:SAF domain-containing protein [Microbacterium sp. LRZ72]|uniref:SAF domain-containing protein n=1 Tax=Microbacterium sp. LRZ72 TaxID=2942481 RepID=UPI0029BE87AE|nr:SAF domain-containing protein [Microbacterium sp. LRZ72]MDX2377067.1 SAF domain-containing protein [Microbacterium sp. LRZ72]
MTTTEPAARARRFWTDARFVIGIVLVAASIGGVWATVAAVTTTVPALAATRTLVPGEIVASADVRAVDVSLGAAQGNYLAPGELEEGAVIERTVGAGELLPAAALADGDSPHVTTVVVTTASAVPARVVEGSVVELWEAPVGEDGGYQTPAIVVADAVVASVGSQDGLLAAETATVELIIPRADVAAVLAGVAAGSALSVVPADAGR